MLGPTLRLDMGARSGLSTPGGSRPTPNPWHRIWSALGVLLVLLAPALAFGADPVAAPPGAMRSTESPAAGDSYDESPPTAAGARAPSVAPDSQRPAPFGSTLFMGNFSKIQEDGLNPDYVVMQGDRVAVSSWGAVEFSGVFVVDGQGNIFLPEIGPVKLEGVQNKDLTEAVRVQMRQVYKRNFDVYTNLLTSKPVAVFVTGAVKRPGRYAGIPSDSILNFLDQAGGVDPERGSYRHITIRRQGQVIAQIDLYDFVLRGNLPRPQLEDDDTILVEQRGPVIELRGDIVQPAMIEFQGQAGVGADALEVVPAEARATEVTVEGIRNGFPFNTTLSMQQFATMPLEHGDVITLRKDYQAETILVRVEGEFKGPSTLSVRRGTGLVDALHYIPVDRELADTASIHLRRDSVARAQKDSINDSLFRLERAALLALSSSNGTSEIRVKEAELTRKFVERARLIDPLGRVVTSQGGSQRNIMLENDDVIVIPSRTSVVRVGGAVLMAQAVMLQEGAKAGDYIEQAGGYSERADHRKVIILHADASVEMGDVRSVIRAGDEILVPPRVDTKFMQGLMDVSTVIYQIAVAAGVALNFALL